MTISTAIPVRFLNNQLTLSERGAEEAPPGVFTEAREAVAVIGDLSNEILKQFRELGLKADNGDLLREVEAVLYGYIKNSNPDRKIFDTLETFGYKVDTDEREAVLDRVRSAALFFDAAGKAFPDSDLAETIKNGI